MKINLANLNPNALLVRIRELREEADNLYHLAGPSLRQFMDTYDLPFSTMNALVKYGEKLVTGVTIITEAVNKLMELAEADSPDGIQSSSSDRQAR